MRFLLQSVDARAYWPHVKCPVLFLNASDDFHAVFDNLFKSANLIPHDDWRASHLMHYNHSLGPQQWILLNRWFDRYLKGEAGDLPRTARPILTLNAAGTSARFTVKPDRAAEVAQLDIYYSHDPNARARARFWIHARSQREGHAWSAQLPVRKNLPLYAVANITYSLAEPAQSFRGEATAYTITSDESVHIPGVVKAEQLRVEARHIPVFDDFEENGLHDWAPTPQGGISTYKFQDPARKTPEPDQVLRITVNVPRERLSYRFRIVKRKWLASVNGPQETYSANRNLKVGDQQQIILRPSDFTERGKNPMTDWNEISTFRFDIYDGAARANLHFTDLANLKLISRMEWVSGRNESMQP